MGCNAEVKRRIYEVLRHGYFNDEKDYVDVSNGSGEGSVHNVEIDNVNFGLRRETLQHQPTYPNALRTTKIGKASVSGGVGACVSLYRCASGRGALVVTSSGKIAAWRGTGPRPTWCG